MSLLVVWCILILVSAAGGGLLVFALMLRCPKQRTRDTLYPLPPTPLRPMDPERWAALAVELGCSPDDLSDYSRRITLFIVSELRVGGSFALERWYGQSHTLVFDRFLPITGIDIPPAPMAPEPLLSVPAVVDGQPALEH